MKRLPESERLAFISDIEGNMEALTAVFDALDREGVKKVYAAGDHLLGGEAPLEVWRELKRRRVSLTRGMSDTALATIDPDTLKPINETEAAKLEVFRKAQSQVGELVLRQLGALPLSMRIPLVDGSELLMVHGSPADPTTEMSVDLGDAELEALIDGDPAVAVLCGASHRAFTRRIDDVEVINVGSVGASPEGPFAYYTIISPRMDGPIVDQRHLRYREEEAED